MDDLFHLGVPGNKVEKSGEQSSYDFLYIQESGARRNILANYFLDQHLVTFCQIYIYIFRTHNENLPTHKSIFHSFHIYFYYCDVRFVLFEMESILSIL